MKTNVPAPLNNLIGQDQPRESLTSLIPGTPLVTVCGPPGVGKSRLAQQRAFELGQQRGSFQAVWWVNLGCVEGTERALDEIAHILGVSLEAGADLDTQLDRLARAMTGRAPTLLWVDDADRHLDLLGALITSALQRRAACVWLVTSRTRLEVPGERVVRLGPMSTDDAEALLTQRLDFLGLPPVPPEPLAQLLDKIDRLPLVLELVASVLEVLSPEEVLDRLTHRQALGRLPFSDGRYESLQEAIGWSWASLEDDEREVLGCCAIFPHTFSLKAVEAVTGALGRDHLDILRGLRSRSLIESVSETTSVRRLKLLSSIRHFARDHLPEESAEAARRAFVAYFAARAQVWATSKARFDSPEILWAVRRDRLNLDAALETALAEGDRASALWLLLALDIALYPTGQLRPLLRGFETALSMTTPLPAHPALLDMALDAAQRIASRSGDKPQALTWASMRNVDDSPLQIARAACPRAVIYWLRGDLATAEAEIARVLAPEALPTDEANRYHSVKGMLAADAGHNDAAERHYRLALRLTVDLGDEISRGVILANLGRLLVRLKRHTEAETAFKGALEVHQRFEIRRLESNTWASLGALWLHQRRHREAVSAFESARRVLVGVVCQGEDVSVWADLSEVYLDTRDLLQAERCLDRALAALHETHLKRVRGQAHWQAGLLAWVRGDLAQAAQSLIEGAACADGMTTPKSTLMHHHLQIVRHLLGRRPPPLDWRTHSPEADRHLTHHLLDAHLHPDGVLGILQEAWTRRGGASPFERNATVRFALRTLTPNLPQEALIDLLAQTLDPAGEALLISPEAKRFRAPGGAWVDLGRRAMPRRFLLELARARQENRILDVEGVKNTLWPGEALVGESGAQRVYQLARAIRSAGLGEALVSESGYSLSSAVRVEWLAMHL